MDLMRNAPVTGSTPGSMKGSAKQRWLMVRTGH
jgi:hypothetical protein